MAKFGGFPGGMGNMQNMIKQAQKMQKDMQEKQEEVAKKEIETSAGGGAVVVKATGDKKIKEIVIKKEVVDPDDIEMLQDLIVAATNEAFRQMEAANSEAMSKLTGGLGGALGGGFPF